MLEKGTSGLMSGEGKRVGRPRLGTAPFLDSTGTCRLHACKNACRKRSRANPETWASYQIAVTVPAIAAAMDSNIDQHS
jgi:hypothetical protein